MDRIELGDYEFTATALKQIADKMENPNNIPYGCNNIYDYLKLVGKKKNRGYLL